jgi:hypothetical protein
MAVLEESTAIVPTSNATYAINITEFDAAGQKSVLSVPIPTDSSKFNQWTTLARAAVLKQTTWMKFTLPQIILAIMFADKLDLDIELGDVYSTDGRPAVSAEGRMKLAMKTGRVEGIKTEFRDTGEALAFPGCVLKTDLECTVTMKIKGWSEPIKRTARLSRWFKNTPAWKERPEHQLELNTTGHLCRLISPIGDPMDTPQGE